MVAAVMVEIMGGGGGSIGSPQSGGGIGNCGSGGGGSLGVGGCGGGGLSDGGERVVCGSDTGKPDGGIVGRGFGIGGIGGTKNFNGFSGGS